MSEPAGWYGNPDGTPTQRFWDGANWTHGVRPVPRPEGFDPTTVDTTGGPAAGAAPPPAEGAPPAVPAAAPSGSVSDLFGLVFDLGMARPISPALARTTYRFGAIMTIVVATLFLLIGLQGGGPAAIVSLVVFPLLALIWLIGLRLLCQVFVDGSTDPVPESS